MNFKLFSIFTLALVFVVCVQLDKAESRVLPRSKSHSNIEMRILERLDMEEYERNLEGHGNRASNEDLIETPFVQLFDQESIKTPTKRRFLKS